MADRTQRGPRDDRAEQIDMRPLLRLAGWGTAAAAALVVAVLAAQSDFGERRVAMAMAPRTQQDAAMAAAGQAAFARAAEVEREARQLAEMVRTLTADRDKLTKRIAALESSLEDLTGSINLTQPMRRAPAATDMFAGAPPAFRPADPAATGAPFGPGKPQPTAEAHAGTPPDPRVAPPIDIRPPSTAGAEGGTPYGPNEIPLPRPNPRAGAPVVLANASPGATTPTAAATPNANAAPANAAVQPAAGADGKRYGVELGTSATADVLRVLWNRIREGQNRDLVADLRPSIALRESMKAGLFEMRLVAGPLPSTLAASRLCVSLSAGGVPCRATTLDGQMLDLP